MPRGGKGLIERISKEATVAVIKHLDGVCHVYIDDRADVEKAFAIAVNEEGGAVPRGYIELRHLASGVKKIVRMSLDSFARYDVEAAMNVMRDDKAIDMEYKSAVREMITYMMEDPREISRVMNILWTLRALERIGDHARNIAEQVIYLVRGMDIRYTPMVEVEKQLETE